MGKTSKRCGIEYTDKEGNKKICKSWGMANGLCRIHGGVRKKGNHPAKSKAVSMKRELKKLYAGLPINGETFHHRLEVMKNNAELMNMRSDVALAETLLHVTVEYLEDNEFKGVDKLKLIDSISKLINTVSVTKETTNKADNNFFDKHNMRFILVQVIELVKQFREELIEELGVEHSLVTRIEKTLVGILNVKITMHCNN